MNQKQRWRRTTRSLPLTLVEIYCKANTKVVKAVHVLFSNNAKLTLTIPFKFHDANDKIDVILL
jgi:hypothetical protein